jgi:hypothetical protein
MKHLALAFSILALTAAVCHAVDSANTVTSAPPAVVRKFLGLFDQLRAAETQKAQGTPQHVAFKLSDAEIDEYMRYSLHAIPRPGLDSVTVKFFPANYISTFTVIDFDAVERWRPGTIPSLLRPVLSGKKSIWVDYRINANNSKISFSVEKAYYQNLRLPAFFVEKMIEIVAARQPEKYDTSKPMEIPFGLTQMWTNDHMIEGRN